MRPQTGILLFVLAATLFAAWFFTVNEKVQREFYVGFRGEARINEYHAAGLLLTELGVETETLSSLTPTEWLPDTNDTLFMRLAAPTTIGEERASLLRWIAGGGHLVLLPPPRQDSNTEDFLLEFGLRLLVPEPVDDDEDEAPEDGEESADEYVLSGNFAQSRIELTAQDIAADIVRDEGDIVVARRDHGSGYLTMLASSEYFNNLYLDEGDNARLFADVSVGQLESGKVWLVYQTSFAPLWEVIWRAAPYLVVTLALLLFLWIWYAMPGFGPKLRTEQAERRSIIEHIRASGMFVWRRQGAEYLLRSATQALIHEADSKHPGITRLSAERQAASIAHITGMPAGKVLDALAGQTESRQREFTHSMQKLQTIRKEL